jgi:cell division protein FtsW
MTSRYRATNSAGTPRRPRSVSWLSLAADLVSPGARDHGGVDVLGLVMVLSASSVEAYVCDGSAYSLFFQQFLGVLLEGGGVLSRVTGTRQDRSQSLICGVRAVHRDARPGVDPGNRHPDPGLQALVLDRGDLVPALGIREDRAGDLGAHLLAIRPHRHDWRGRVRDVLLPLLPGAGLMCMLVVLQPNLSTTITLGTIVLALLWLSGFDKLLFGGLLLGCLSAATLLTFTSGYRADRIKSLFNLGSDPQGLGYQAMQAKFALADGGLTGQGLGQSESKWSYPPNAYNDFIFAIVGEELGLIGCVTVTRPIRVPRFRRNAHCGAVGRSFPATARRRVDYLDLRAGRHQYRRRGRAAARDRAAASVDFLWWYLEYPDIADVWVARQTRHATNRPRSPRHTRGDR